MSTEPETAAMEAAEPYDHLLDGNCGCKACCRRSGMPDGPAGQELAAGPGIPPWDDLRERSNADLAALRERTGIAMADVAGDHEAALDALDERPVIPQEPPGRPAGDDGQPFDVAAGSFLAAAACPSCGYGLGGRTAVHVLAGRGGNRTAVAVHEECSGEAP